MIDMFESQWRIWLWDKLWSWNSAEESFIKTVCLMFCRSRMCCFNWEREILHEEVQGDPKGERVWSVSPSSFPLICCLMVSGLSRCSRTDQIWSDGLTSPEDGQTAGTVVVFEREHTMLSVTLITDSDNIHHISYSSQSLYRPATACPSSSEFTLQLHACVIVLLFSS